MPITTRIEGRIETAIYTTEDGYVAIAQLNDTVVLLSSDQLVDVIRKLEVCYDNRAHWQAPTQLPAGTGSTSSRRQESQN